MASSQPLPTSSASSAALLAHLAAALSTPNWFLHPSLPHLPALLAPSLPQMLDVPLPVRLAAAAVRAAAPARHLLALSLPILFRLHSLSPPPLRPLFGRPFGSLLTHLSRFTLNPLILRLFAHMHLHSPPAPTGATYNVLIRSLCRRADLARALRYLSLMIRSGWSPDAYTFNSMIVGYCRTHQANAARDLFDKMPLRGFQQDVVSYAAMIEGLCEMGMIDDALELFREMEQPDIHAYAVLVKGLCEAGRGEEGLQIGRAHV